MIEKISTHVHGNARQELQQVCHYWNDALGNDGNEFFFVRHPPTFEIDQQPFVHGGRPITMQSAVIEKRLRTSCGAKFKGKESMDAMR